MEFPSEHGERAQGRGTAFESWVSHAGVNLAEITAGAPMRWLLAALACRLVTAGAAAMRGKIRPRVMG